MTGGDRSGPPQPDGAGEDLRDLARDWITLWQSELAALAVDRELQETWHVVLALWAGAAGAMLQGLPRGMPDDGHGPGNGAGAAAAPRPAPAAHAPDARDAEVEQLRHRVAELERRLAGLERRSR
ncbi:conserved protein of unknown function [Rhodovastum atsumiense]|uniref:hypothetical protein n=1 Tax=Rhodovastum atsumiense TaxID=504468 RepID=UPI001EEFB236|nr:hypothetical protein [Rhodovastum atsumiense]CAH2600301.1 conserved protein of unknown function [Rhodovastum atsumiense]